MKNSDWLVLRLRTEIHARAKELAVKDRSKFFDAPGARELLRNEHWEQYLINRQKYWAQKLGEHAEAMIEQVAAAAFKKLREEQS